MLGMTDIWTPIQFDAAVSYFGVWMDNKLQEYDYDKKPPKPKYDIKDLLSDNADAGRDLRAYQGDKGIATNLRGIRRRQEGE